jgi:membrane-associated phospholipid phosphatase
MVKLLYLLAFLPLFCKAQNIDIDVLRKINSSNPSQYWIQTTNSAYWMPVVASAGIIAYAFKNEALINKQHAYQTPFSIGIGLGLSETIKLIVNRERPGDQYPDIIHPYNVVHGHSFPSGHTTSAFLLASSLSFQYKKSYVAVPAYLWAASVGYSRMKLGEHFPTDVLAGMITGTAGAYFSKLITPQIKK